MRPARIQRTYELTAGERMVIRALVGGMSLGMVLLCGIAVFYLYQTRPRGWDATGIRAVQQDTTAIDLSAALPAAAGQALSPAAQPGSAGKAEMRVATGIIHADLANTTTHDATLSRSVPVMEGQSGTRILRNSKLMLDRDYFLPAGHIVSVTMSADLSCPGSVTPEICIESYLHSVDEIVLFDRGDRDEVHIPLTSIGAMSIQPATAALEPASR